MPQKGAKVEADMAVCRMLVWMIVLAVVLAGVVPVWAQASSCVTHTVAEGESLARIARRYKTTVDAIVSQNGIAKGKPIKPGQVLEIPPLTGTCGKAASASGRREQGASTSGDAGRISATPAPWTQTQKSAQERGVNPCYTPDPGFRLYDPWDRSPSMGQMITTQAGGITKDGKFDVMFHFHGHDAVRKEWVQVMDGAVLVGIDLGIGSGPYEAAFRSTEAFARLVKSVEAGVAKKSGNSSARVRKVGLSAWSAGYGAVGEILRTQYGQQLVDTVVLLDGLHCGYKGRSLNDWQLEPFLRFAKQAAQGNKLMFVSHSSIIPPGYASTTETAYYLVHGVNGQPQSTVPRAVDPMGLDLISRYDKGGFHVRGFKGNDKMDHCAHIGLMRDVLKVHVYKRWQSPKGRRATPRTQG